MNMKKWVLITGCDLDCVKDIQQESMKVSWGSRQPEGHGKQTCVKFRTGLKNSFHMEYNQM